METMQQHTQPLEDIELREPAAHERAELLTWLNQALRRGEAERLQAEYPTALAEDPANTHCVAWRAGRPVAHALTRMIRVQVADCEARLGMIGLVYTDPEFRSHGLASRCVQAGIEKLRAQGAHLAVLWSDQLEFYQRLGFSEAGQQTLYTFDASVVAPALRSTGAHFEVGPVKPQEWPQLESLYMEKSAHTLRGPGELQRLAAAPSCEIRVARSAHKPVAYAAIGRGDDFPDICHEWAGQTAGVLACLAEFLETRPVIGWLNGPEGSGPVKELVGAGGLAHPGCFALMRPLDLEGLWRAVARRHPALRCVRLTGQETGFSLEWDNVRVPLDASAALELLLGGEFPEAIASQLDAERAESLRSSLPWPLFVWGFDSI